jgi:integrase/recombinase XerD
VNVIKMVKMNGKWPFAPVVERNGKIIRDHVLIKGSEEHHPEGRYYIEWHEDGGRRREAVASFDLVLQAARAKAIELKARKAGVLPSSKSPEIIPPVRTTLASAIDKYLDYVKVQRSLRTYRTYRPTLDALLRNSYTKTYIDEVTREDILKFMGDCFDLELGARTVYDKLVVVLRLFKRNGQTELIEPNDWPEYVDIIRPIYEPDEIGTMLKHAEPEEAMLIKFCVASGFRDREIRHVVWRDIDFLAGTCRTQYIEDQARCCTIK